jgi:hypothetical protein
LLSHPKGGGAARDEGTLWGDSFQGGPECSPSVLSAAREGGTARESKNEPEKKGRSARGGMPEKNAETCLGQHGTYLPAAAGKSMPMPPCVVETTKQWEFYSNRPIDRKKWLITRLRVVSHDDKSKATLEGAEDCGERKTS